MLNISGQELAVIGVCLLILLRPKDFPKLAHTIGKLFRTIRLTYIRVTDDLLSIYENENNSNNDKN